MLAERVKEWVEEWKQEGRQESQLEAWQEGQEDGRQKEAAKLFMLLLKSKFGSVNQQIQDKVNAASPELIEKWTEQIFEATTPENLLNS